MAVLFPTPNGTTLRPDKPAQLLQGFLNISDTEGVKNGKLTKANLDGYAQKQFFALDPNSSVASYLNQNYVQIADNDGDASSISADDLVQIRNDLPKPSTNPIPPNNNPGQAQICGFLLQFMQRFMQLFSSMFR